MPVLNIKLSDLESVKTGLTILQAIVSGGGKLATSALHAAESVTGKDINKDGVVGTPEDGTTEDVLGSMFPEENGDALGGLFPEEQAPTGPTIDSLKDAITALSTAKGRDTAKNLVVSILTKLSVKTLEEVPTEKYGAVIDILKKATV